MIEQVLERKKNISGILTPSFSSQWEDQMNHYQRDQPSTLKKSSQNHKSYLNSYAQREKIETQPHRNNYF